MRIKGQCAFTLVETMVTALLFALVLGGIYTTVLVGNASWQNYEAAVLVQQDTRRAVAYMARDFRVAQNLKITSTPGSLVADFNHPKDGEVRYSWLRRSNDSAGQLIRQTNSASRTIGKDITSISITDSQQIVSFSVTTSRISRQGKALAFSLTHRVARR